MRSPLLLFALLLGGTMTAQVVLDHHPARMHKSYGKPISPDTAQAIIRRLADAVYAERLVTTRGYQDLYHQKVDVSASEDSMAAMDAIRQRLIGSMKYFSWSRERCDCYVRLNDSLEAVARSTRLLAKPKEAEWARKDRRNYIETECYKNSGFATPSIDYHVIGLSADSLFGKDIVALRDAGGKVDSAAYGLPPRELAARLLRTGLIDPSIERRWEHDLAWGRISNYTDLLEVASQELAPRTNVRIQREERLAWIADLVSIGRLDSSAAAPFVNSTDPHLRVSEQDVLSRCAGAATITWNDLPPTTAGMFAQSYDSIRTMLPDVRWGALSYTSDTADIAPGTYRNVTEPYRVVTQYFQFTLDDHAYGCAIREVLNTRPSYDDPYSLLSTVNKALCDVGRSDKVSLFARYERCDSCDEVWLRSGFTLVAMDTAMVRAYRAYKGWHTDYRLYLARDTTSIGDRNLDGLLNSFCRDEIDHAIERFRSVGVFSHLDPVTFDSSVVVAQRDARDSWPAVMSCFPHLLVRLTPHVKSEEDLFAELASSSKGTFDPNRVQINTHDGSNWKPPTVSFSWRGKRYRNEAGFSHSPVFLVDAANKALAAAGVDGRFCPMRDEHHWAIFLTRAQYDALHDEFLSDYYDPWEVPKSAERER
jgi:hypothetical protein